MPPTRMTGKSQFISAMERMTTPAIANPPVAFLNHTGRFKNLLSIVKPVLVAALSLTSS